MINCCQVSGDGPRFLTDSDTKRVTVAGQPGRTGKEPILKHPSIHLFVILPPG